MQSTNLYDVYLMLYVQSWTPDDGWKDRPKNDTIYLLTAIGLSPGGSTHLHTNNT